MTRSIALIIICLIFPIIGYLSGSLLWSVIIGKLFFNKDVRKFESCNAGATNSSRVFGKHIGILILFLDVIKSLIPTITIWLINRYALQDYLNHSINYFDESSLVFLTSLFCIIGHCYPIFFKFKGGKGVSCYGAMLIAISPFVSLLALLFFVLIILITKYVSLGSIIGSIIGAILIFIPGVNWMYMLNTNINEINIIYDGNNITTICFIFSLVLLSSCLIIFKHRSNITRLINHEERKINLKK